jgi:hypothetical protein
MTIRGAPIPLDHQEELYKALAAARGVAVSPVRKHKKRPRAAFSDDDDDDDDDPAPIPRNTGKKRPPGFSLPEAVLNENRRSKPAPKPAAAAAPKLAPVPAPKAAPKAPKASGAPAPKPAAPPAPKPAAPPAPKPAASTANKSTPATKAAIAKARALELQAEAEAKAMAATAAAAKRKAAKAAAAAAPVAGGGRASSVASRRSGNRSAREDSPPPAPADATSGDDGASVGGQSGSVAPSYGGSTVAAEADLARTLGRALREAQAECGALRNTLLAYADRWAGYQQQLVEQATAHAAALSQLHGDTDERIRSAVAAAEARAAEVHRADLGRLEALHDVSVANARMYTALLAALSGDESKVKKMIAPL